MGRSEWYRGEKESPGCMSGMLHYLDFHHLLFAAGGVSRAPPDSSPRGVGHPKGLEAPRNSLELDEGKSTAAEFYDVPFELGIQLTTNKKMVVFEEERRSTQAETPRTPSLVARLMGLDGLPESASSSPPATGFQTPVGVREESKKNKKNKKKKVILSEECKKASPTQPQRQPLRNLNCNSPPALPQIRLDVGSRSLPDTPRASSVRSWELESKLSLHSNNNNKENVDNVREDLSLPRKIKDLGRQQLEENKSPRSHHYAREIVKQVKESVTNRRAANGDQSGVQSKRTRPPMKNIVLCGADEENLRIQPKILEQPKSKLENNFVLVKPSRPPPPPPVVIREQVGVKAAKCKRDSCERFPPAQRSEASSPDLIKRGSSSAATTTARCIQKSSHLPQEQDPEYRYVRSILSRGGCTGSRIDPIVFHQLELDLPFNLLGPIRHRWNRRLLFHLVQEILDELHHERRRRLASEAPTSVLNVNGVWERIRRLPAADCRVLGDIDALVAGDLAEANVRRVLRHPAVAGEAEGVVAEVGEAIADDLLGEAAAAMLLLLTSRRIQ